MEKQYQTQLGFSARRDYIANQFSRVLRAATPVNMTLEALAQILVPGMGSKDPAFAHVVSMYQHDRRIVVEGNNIRGTAINQQSYAPVHNF